MDDRARTARPWDDLTQTAGLDGHIAFAQRLVDKYQWSEQAQRELTASLEQIHAKQQDDQLNISVVGEFSTGKSTFINAMLRREMLASAALQGTTLAATVIEYAPELCIRLQHKYGRVDTMRYDSLDRLQASLRVLTTTPEEAGQYRSITVGLPTKTLAQGFRIIDTPGTNALESWHEEVTVRTLREMSDLSVVLVNAIQPVPDTLCRFIDANLSDVLGRCVFVVTKLDLVPAGERERMLAYITQRLEQRFGLHDPLVIPYVSPAVLADAAAPVAQQDRPELLELSYAGEARLLHAAARYKTVAQVRKLISLVDRMYEDIAAQMEQLSAGYQGELETLLRERRRDLEAFVQEQGAVRCAAFDRSASDIRSAAAEAYRTQARTAKEAMLQALDGPGSVDALAVYVKNELAQDCTDRARAMSHETWQQAGELQPLFAAELGTFQKAFCQTFQDLSVLYVDNWDVEVPAVQVDDFQLSDQYIQGQVKRENRRLGIGAVAGAVVGSVLLPGIGGALGGLFLGGLAGAPGKKSVLQAREGLRSQMSAPFQEYFDGTADKMMKSFDRYQEALRARLVDEIERYARAYGERVQKRIDEEAAKRQQLQVRLEALRADMREIEGRKDQLAQMARQIDALGGI